MNPRCVTVSRGPTRLCLLSVPEPWVAVRHTFRYFDLLNCFSRCFSVQLLCTCMVCCDDIILSNVYIFFAWLKDARIPFVKFFDSPPHTLRILWSLRYCEEKGKRVIFEFWFVIEIWNTHVYCKLVDWSNRLSCCVLNFIINFQGIEAKSKLGPKK